MGEQPRRESDDTPNVLDTSTQVLTVSVVFYMIEIIHIISYVAAKVPIYHN